tara:strand:- start:2717 stop:3388 length:672 start_codon:yes stop_codon:yes gene_type:complete
MKKKLFISFIVVTFFFISSFNPRVSEKITDNLFQVKNIIIKNNQILTENSILNEINSVYNKNLFLLNSKELYKLISKIDFIESAQIKKIYPNTLKILIKEKKPVAMLHIDKKKYYVLRTGEKINFIENNNFKNLPVIFGFGIKEFPLLYKTLEKINFKLNQINSFYYFKIGRWDIKLNNGILIKLPEKEYEKSLEKFIKVYSEIKRDKYKIFDFRIENQLILN